jgi:predicted nucleic acid-binding protein
MLIDTDILIDFLRGKPGARDFFSTLPADTMFCCSVITVAELHAGMRESEQEKTMELINSLIVLPITKEVAELTGIFKREAKGFDLELDDCFIAATAVIEGSELATRNARHYPMSQVRLMVADY